MSITITIAKINLTEGHVYLFCFIFIFQSCKSSVEGRKPSVPYHYTVVFSDKGKSSSPNTTSTTPRSQSTSLSPSHTLHQDSGFTQAVSRSQQNPVNETVISRTRQDLFNELSRSNHEPYYDRSKSRHNPFNDSSTSSRSLNDSKFSTGLDSSNYSFGSSFYDTSAESISPSKGVDHISSGFNSRSSVGSNSGYDSVHKREIGYRPKGSSIISYAPNQTSPMPGYIPLNIGDRSINNGSMSQRGQEEYSSDNSHRDRTVYSSSVSSRGSPAFHVTEKHYNVGYTQSDVSLSDELAEAERGGRTVKNTFDFERPAQSASYGSSASTPRYLSRSQRDGAMNHQRDIPRLALQQPTLDNSSPEGMS